MKPCPFCFGNGRIQRMRGAAGIPIFAIACTNEKCLTVGPLAATEVEAHKKWDARNMNIARPKSKAA